MSKVEENKQTKVSTRPYFVNEKSKAQTPVLRKKQNEAEDKFFERMAGIGYTTAKISGNHWSGDQNALHSGPQDKCKLCRKATKVMSKSEKPAISNPSPSKTDKSPAAPADVSKTSTLADVVPGSIKVDSKPVDDGKVKATDITSKKSSEKKDKKGKK